MALLKDTDGWPSVTLSLFSNTEYGMDFESLSSLSGHRLESGHCKNRCNGFIKCYRNNITATNQNVFRLSNRAHNVSSHAIATLHSHKQCSTADTLSILQLTEEGDNNSWGRSTCTCIPHDKEDPKECHIVTYRIRLSKSKASASVCFWASRVSWVFFTSCMYCTLQPLYTRQWPLSFLIFSFKAHQLHGVWGAFGHHSLKELILATLSAQLSWKMEDA